MEYFCQSSICIFTETSVFLWYAVYLTHSNYLSQELGSDKVWETYLQVFYLFPESWGKQEDARKIALKVRDCFLVNVEEAQSILRAAANSSLQYFHLSERLKGTVSEFYPLLEALKKSIDNGPLEMTGSYALFLTISGKWYFQLPSQTLSSH